MKRIITIFITALLSLTILYGYSRVQDHDVIESENVVSTIRKVDDFTEISVKSAFEIVLTKGDKNEVKIVAAKDEHLEKIITEVTDGKLNVYTKGGIKTKESIRINITYKELNGIEQRGAAEISATNPIKTNNFYLRGSGATEVKLEVDVESLIVDFSGASEIQLDGNTNMFKLALSGASELKAEGLKSQNASIDISGASEVQLYVTESIGGETSGVSSIKVKGGVSLAKVKTSGISSISKG